MAKKLHYDFAGLPSLTGHDDYTSTGTPDLSITRATTASVTDYFNVLKTVNSGEERFTGARRVENLLLRSSDFTNAAIWDNGDITITTGVTDKDGGTTGATLTATGANQILKHTNISTANPSTNTNSCWIKRRTGTGNVDLLRPDGSLYDTLAVTSEWQRFSATKTHSAAFGYFWIRLATSGDEVDICFPQFETVSGQDDPSPSEYIPTTTAAVSQWYATKRRTNLLLQSNDLSTTWTNVRTTDSQSAGTDPFGGAAANSINEDGTAANTHYIYQNLTNLLDNETYTYSVYAKASNRTGIRLSCLQKDGTTAFSDFDLSAGTAGTNGGEISVAISDVGSGWYRCSVTFDSASGASTPNARLWVAESDGDVTFDGLSQESVLVYGAQLERGSAATDYIATTTAVASSGFDTAITPTGLLIEEARTNICVQSEDFGTTWLALNNAVVNADQTTAPDGTLTADQIIDNAATGTGSCRVAQNLTVSNTTAYTYSIFAKADQLSWAKLAVSGNGAEVIEAYYDLTNGVVGATLGADNDDQGIEDVGGGWYRCWLSYTSADTSNTANVYPADADNDITVDLDGTSSIFVWGAQFEAGAFLSSYIPTTTGSVTRNRDQVETSTVSWYDESVGGSWYSEASTFSMAADQGITSISDGTANDRVETYINQPTGNSIMLATAGGSNSLNTGGGTSFSVKDAMVRSAAAIAANDAKGYQDGVAAGLDSSVTLPTGLTQFNLGSLYDSVFFLNGHIKEIRYYDERLDDNTLDLMSQGIFPVEGHIGIGLGFGKMGAQGAA